MLESGTVLRGIEQPALLASIDNPDQVAELLHCLKFFCQCRAVARDDAFHLALVKWPLLIVSHLVAPLLWLGHQVRPQPTGVVLAFDGAQKDLVIIDKNIERACIDVRQGKIFHDGQPGRIHAATKRRYALQ